MITAYLRSDYHGAYSKKLYASAGSEVKIIGRHDNMALVIDGRGEKMWLPDIILSPIKPNPNELSTTNNRNHSAQQGTTPKAKNGKASRNRR